MKTRSKETHRLNLAVLLLLGLVVGCGRDATQANTAPVPDPSDTVAGMEVKIATAVISSTEGNNVRGTVRFVQEKEGVRVVADLSGLKPGQHGMHVHENADCSAPDGKSAGEHYNPTHTKHADREALMRHMGDLGNITADADGRGQVNYLDPKLMLGGVYSIVGRSVVIHADPDDGSSQPAGNSGARVGCGAIQIGER